ncbi:hypothetical protein PIB30_032329 [Stylosanthes scabra]|uniref:Uncharacterized protein n=1 Tax=Stylosanthes scabra TaxID=79078 RepID=A0ABU6SBU3_9FABA|nr:hypothetical protein [Stylosanthes scabra]
MKQQQCRVFGSRSGGWPMKVGRHDELGARSRRVVGRGSRCELRGVIASPKSETGQRSFMTDADGGARWFNYVGRRGWLRRKVPEDPRWMLRDGAESSTAHLGGDRNRKDRIGAGCLDRRASAPQQDD